MIGEDVRPLPQAEVVVLELAKTRVRVVGAELQRLNKNGNVVLRLPIQSIQSVDYHSRFDPMSMVFAAIGCGLGAIGYLISENNVLTALLYSAAVLLVGGSILACQSQRIVIEAASGVIEIQNLDQPDEGKGFVYSLRGILLDQPGGSNQLH